MPAPMRPAPSTPTCLTSRAGFPYGDFFVAVWLKKMPRSAALTSVIPSFPNSSRSTLLPASCPPAAPAATALRIASIAGYLPPVFLSTPSLAFLNSTDRPTGLSSNKRLKSAFFFVPALRLPSSSSRAADRLAWRSACGSTTSCTRPMRFALSALMFCPVIIICSAAWMPTTFGRRCVPPAPGSRPSCDSGTESTVLGLLVAMR
mmetsp:Transcript_7218/g.25797  ORF Transcript_7218/g.25797 Transcript_7218/m.25797 type:complete len:204 (+) Transcript_7218:1346-1957(+)